MSHSEYLPELKQFVNFITIHFTVRHPANLSVLEDNLGRWDADQRQATDALPRPVAAK